MQMMRKTRSNIKHRVTIKVVPTEITPPTILTVVTKMKEWITNWTNLVLTETIQPTLGVRPTTPTSGLTRMKIDIMKQTMGTTLEATDCTKHL